MEITERSFVLIKLDSTDTLHRNKVCSHLSLFQFHGYIPDYLQTVIINGLHLVLRLGLLSCLKEKQRKFDRKK